MEHWNNCSLFFFWLKTFYYSTLCFFVLWTSTFYFFYYRMISLSGYFGFWCKLWIQLSGFKIYNVGRRLIQLRFTPIWEGQTSSGQVNGWVTYHLRVSLEVSHHLRLSISHCALFSAFSASPLWAVWHKAKDQSDMKSSSYVPLVSTRIVICIFSHLRAVGWRSYW